MTTQTQPWLKPYHSATTTAQHLLMDRTNLEKLLLAVGLNPKANLYGFACECPLHNSRTGQPLTIRIVADKVPIQCKCFNPACANRPPDIISLVQALRGNCKGGEALTFIAKVLGYSRWQDLNTGQVCQSVQPQGVSSTPPVIVPTQRPFPVPSVGEVSQYLIGRGIARDVSRAHGCYDVTDGYFNGRVVIPVADSDGNQVGLIGRARFPQCSTCEKFHPTYKGCDWGLDHRYIYDKGFAKSHYLFNHHRAKLTNSKTLIIVEGAIDVMTLESNAIFSVVALMGSQFSKEQEMSLNLFSVGRIFVATDADKEGDHCYQSIYSRCNNRYEVRRLDLKGAHDPASMTRDQVMEVFGDI